MTTQIEIIQQLLGLADTLMETGETDSARKILEKIIGIDSENVDALNLLCLISFQKGNPKKAIEYLDRTIHILGTSTELLKNRSILLQSANRFRDALNTLSTAATLTPKDASIYSMKAAIFQHLGRLDDAIEQLDKATNADPESSEISCQLSTIKNTIEKTNNPPITKDVQENEAFCILPWIHSYFFPNGTATLCCISATPLLDDNGDPMNIQTHSLEEIWNSTSLRKARSSMLSGKKISNCSNCYNEEKFSNNSHRLMYNTHWLHGDGSKKAPNLLNMILARKEKNIVDKPISVDYRFGNICNLKCQICNAGNSSQIERDPEHSRWNQAPFLRIKPNRFQNRTSEEEWYESPDLIKEIISFSDQVLEIKLAGGEPTLNKSLVSFMKNLVDSGKSKEIDISISTNFTTGNRALYSIFEAFKNIRLYISIDGYRSMNEYLRFPSKWSIIEKNVTYLESLRKIASVEVAITPVINVYNALTIVELFQWADSLDFGNASDVVRGVSQIDCLILPRKTREEAIKRLNAYAVQCGSKAKHDNAIILGNKLNGDLPQSVQLTNLRNFVKFTQYIDSSRNLSFPEVAPETYSQMVEHFGDEMTPLNRNNSKKIRTKNL